MAFPTTGSQTELQAVNQILASVGQAPVTSLDQTNPDVSICYETMLQVSREVQSEGWSFNREYNYPIVPNADDEIVYSNNMLQLDLSLDKVYNRNKDSIKRDGKLYDKLSHSYKWTQTVYCDVTWYFDWQDLPIPIQDYIVARASATVSMRIVGDPTLYQTLQQQEAYLRSNALEYETQQGDYSFFGSPPDGNYYRPYKPFHTLYR
jgi:hypothetical protein